MFSPSRIGNFLVAITLLCLVINCTPKENSSKIVCKEKVGFKICSDTTYLSFDGFLTRLISIDKNKIYGILIKENKIGHSKHYESHLLIFNKSGKIFSKTPLPSDFEETVYYNLKINNDSLILLDAQHKTPFYFDEMAKKWCRLEKFIPIVYEDRNFKVTSVCYGEFGGIAYFHDKTTLQVYETDATCLNSVSKLGNNYFLTNQLGHMLEDSYLVKIFQPNQLPLAEKPLKLQSVFDYSAQANLKGSEVILDSIGINIRYSFVYKNKLYQVLSADNRISFGEIKNGKILKVNTPFDILTTNFQQQIMGNNIVCDFYEEGGKCGLIFYANEELSLLYILNKKNG